MLGCRKTTAETGEIVVEGINDVFVAGTVKGTTYEDLHLGISIINTTFFNRLPALYQQIPSANISTIQLDWQPIVYLCYAEVVEWIGSAYDHVVAEWLEKTTYAINNATQKAGLYDHFNYMGDSAGFQSIFPGYGAKNHQKLISIAQKYDPHGVFQNLMPGGFKVY